MNSATPLVSVVTITRDNLEGLRRTAASVVAQTCGDYEHVVIDGASTDGTAAWLAAQAHPRLRWVSEPDGGIASAFNKGLRLSRGAYLNFLNAGDSFVDAAVLERVAPRLDGAAILTGHTVSEGIVSPPYPVGPEEPLPRRAWLSHQASFVHRRVFDACGGFDERLRICMDYDFWLRALQRFAHVPVPEVWVDFEPGGVSARNRRLWLAELRAVNRAHLRGATLINFRLMARVHLHDVLERLALLDRYRALRLRRALAAGPPPAPPSGPTPPPAAGSDRQNAR